MIASLPQLASWFTDVFDLWMLLPFLGIIVLIVVWVLYRRRQM